MEKGKTVIESYYCNVFADGEVGTMKHESLKKAKSYRYLDLHYKGVNNYIVWSDGSVETHFIHD